MVLPRSRRTRICTRVSTSTAAASPTRRSPTVWDCRIRGTAALSPPEQAARSGLCAGSRKARGGNGCDQRQTASDSGRCRAQQRGDLSHGTDSFCADGNNVRLEAHGYKLVPPATSVESAAKIATGVAPDPRSTVDLLLRSAPSRLKFSL